MWTRKDSENLASIEKSLRLISEREQERALVSANPISFLEMFKSKKRAAEKEIAVFESQDLGEIAEDELMEVRAGINRKLERAKAQGTEPFFVEDLLNAEELDAL